MLTPHHRDEKAEHRVSRRFALKETGDLHVDAEKTRRCLLMIRMHEIQREWIFTAQSSRALRPTGGLGGVSDAPADTADIRSALLAS